MLAFGAQNILERKVDKVDMIEGLKTRASKKDIEMMQRTIVILHK